MEHDEDFFERYKDSWYPWLRDVPGYNRQGLCGFSESGLCSFLNRKP
jgi:hypothetical protein